MIIKPAQDTIFEWALLHIHDHHGDLLRRPRYLPPWSPDRRLALACARIMIYD
ncbi:hypothetical protein ACFL0D_01700 [Thermoproteota archaeon]